MGATPLKRFRPVHIGLVRAHWHLGVVHCVTGVGHGDMTAGMLVCMGCSLLVAARYPGSRWRDCHFADALSPSLLKHPMKVEGGQQNDSLADG